MKGKAFLALLVLAGVLLAIQPAENWTVGTTGKYNQTANANYATEGGNVTEINLSGNISTEKWAGFWGNVTGKIVLAPGAGQPMFFTWTWNSSRGGEVCAIAAASGFDWAGVQTIAASAIDTVWGFAGGDTDSAANTLSTSCAVDVAGTSVSGSAGNFTGVGGFETCAVADQGSPAAKADVAFCVNITYNGTLFNSQAGDYELLVATNEVAGQYETYYFWLELD